MRVSDKPLLLLDIGTLGGARDKPMWARGIHRVSQHLFDGLLKADAYDLQFVSTSDLAASHDFLAERGLRPEQSLRCSATQLQLSRLGRKAANWVHDHMTIPGLPARVARRSMALAASAAKARDSEIPLKFLESADLYHSPLAPLPPSVAQARGLASFLTIHDLLGLTLPQFLPAQSGIQARKLIASLSPQSSVFCVSETVKADVLELTSLPAERVFVSRLAADKSRFYQETNPARIEEIRSRYQLPPPPYFLTLSSFDPRKNFGHIIKCFRTLVLSGELPDAKLVIVGSNPERNRFVEEALSQNSEVRNRVVMPGFIPDEDLAAVYSPAQAFLFPSFGEGFGLPVLEAMQCGTPVICSNTTSLPEVAGNAGVLLPPQDEDAWCHAMATASSLEDLREKGIERSKLFTWERYIHSILDGYAQGLARR